MATTMVEGPLGIKMSEPQARATEAILVGLNADCKELVSSGPMRKATTDQGQEVQLGERTDVSTVTSEAIDREREVVISKGLNWKTFQLNPVVTMAHNYQSLPVGRSLWQKRVEKSGRWGWTAKTQYPTAPEDHEGPWLPSAVFHLIKEGIMPGKSIGFLPLDVTEPTTKERDQNEWGTVRRVIRSAEVLEYAVVPVPCNAEALVESVGKAWRGGLIIPDALQQALMAALEKSEEQPEPEIKKLVENPWLRILRGVNRDLARR